MEQRKRKEIVDVEYETVENKRIKIDAEIQDKSTEKKREIEEAKERQIYNPLEKIFDFGKRRVTYIKENSKVHLPKPLKANEEGELEMIREILVGEFKKSIRKKQKKKQRKQRKKEKIEKRENKGISFIKHRIE